MFHFSFFALWQGWFVMGTIIEMLPYMYILLICLIVFLISSKMKIQYTILLFIFGFILGEFKNDSLAILLEADLSPDLLLFVFFPVLIMECGYMVNLKDLWSDIAPLIGLSVFSLLISAISIALGMYYLLPILNLEIPFLVCLLFGSAISATDPVAALAIMKTANLPERLVNMLNIESLLNDGTAYALFSVLLFCVINECGVEINHAKSLFDETLHNIGIVEKGFLTFLSTSLVGILFGLFTGIIAVYLSKKDNDSNFKILTFTLGGYLTFLESEVLTHNILPVSGIIATTIYSIYIGNNINRIKMAEHFWECISFFFNSLIFILLGIKIANQGFHPEIAISSIIVVAIVALSRAISIYSIIGTINLFIFKKEKEGLKVPKNYQHILAFASLRGALAIIMLLMIPSEIKVNFQETEVEVKSLFLEFAGYCIIFTLLFKANALPFLIKKLKIKK